MDLIYLDHNSTTPVFPEVVEAMRPYWHEHFANPASAHRAGQRARQALEARRELVAALLDAEPDEVVFTSGATEANNLALLGLAGDRPGEIVVSPVEHPSVTEPAARLASRGFAVPTLGVDSTGIVQERSYRALVSDTTRLASVMLVNNETGAIQPVAQFAQHAPLVAFHCDAVQAVGKMPVRFHTLGVATLSLSAHKFGGPRGIGALLVRRGTRLTPLFHGGHQQRGLRPGTEAVPLVVGLAKALELACSSLDLRLCHVRQLRGRFLEQLQRNVAPVVVNGPPDALPYTLNISFPGCQADTLLMKLDLAGVACSTGSACSSGSLLPSPTLRAMGCPPDVLHSAMRFSFSSSQTLGEIEEAAHRVAQCVSQLRTSA